MQQSHMEMMLSMTTVVLAIFAISVFIYYGGSELFYAVAVLAMVIGFMNFRLISRAGARGSTGARPRPRGRRSSAS